ncbi:MAG: hypothetical protein ACHQX3_03740 [Nitrospirales bacterium]
MQSRLSNDEVIEEITSSINRNMNHGPSPIQFTPDQVIEMLGGPKLAEHLTNIVDDFEMFVDADDTIQLSVKVGEEDETEFYVPPDFSERVHDYLFPIPDSPTRSIHVFKNAVTIFHFSGEDITKPFMITMWAHKKAQFVATEDGETPIEGAPKFDHPEQCAAWIINKLDDRKAYTVHQI